MEQGYTAERRHAQQSSQKLAVYVIKRDTDTDTNSCLRLCLRLSCLPFMPYTALHVCLCVCVRRIETSLPPHSCSAALAAQNAPGNGRSQHSQLSQGESTPSMVKDSDKRKRTTNTVKEERAPSIAKERVRPAQSGRSARPASVGYSRGRAARRPVDSGRHRRLYEGEAGNQTLSKGKTTLQFKGEINPRRRQSKGKSIQGEDDSSFQRRLFISKEKAIQGECGAKGRAAL
jgi:hypothetical protein